MPESLSPEEVLVRELRAWRERRGLTAQQLADRTKGQLSRQAISKIENGDRRVTLNELVGLAYALGVPPILLTMPLGKDPYVQLLPDLAVPTWDAVKWWMGEDSVKRWLGERDASDPAAVLEFFRDHDKLALDVIYTRATEPEQAPAYVERLRDLRKNMRRAGVLPPELPDALADIEKE